MGIKVLIIFIIELWLEGSPIKLKGYKLGRSSVLMMGF